MHYAFLILMGAYLAGNIYIFIRGLQTIAGAPTVWKIAYAIIFWIVALGFFLTMAARDADIPEHISRAMFRIGSSWMVFILYMVLILLILDIAKIFIPSLRFGILYAFGITLCLMIYGYLNYRNPDVVELDITLDKPISEDIRIVAISDVHLGDGTGKEALKRYVKLINAQQPDVVIIGGDMIDNSIHPLYRDRMWEELSQIEAPQGIYMVPGNHEYISGIEEVTEFINKTPIRLLRDEVVTLANGIQIVGRDDRHNRSRQTLKALLDNHTDPNLPTLVVDHQPYKLAQVDSLGVDLQFSGHTHHGQVWPISLITDRMYEQSYGFRHWSHAQIFVSSGLSLWGPPFRIGTDSDLAVFNIRAK